MSHEQFLHTARRSGDDKSDRRAPGRPDQETKNRKPLPCLIPNFESVPPIWELRVGNYRVYYDVDLEAGKVYVRAVRKKPLHRTTKEVL